jgi:hypothetical protein
MITYKYPFKKITEKKLVKEVGFDFVGLERIGDELLVYTETKLSPEQKERLDQKIVEHKQEEKTLTRDEKIDLILNKLIEMEKKI